MHRFYYVAGRHYTSYLAIMNEALTDLANAGVRYNLRSGNKVFVSSFYLQQNRRLYDLERPTTKNASTVTCQKVNRILLIGQ